MGKKIEPSKSDHAEASIEGDRKGRERTKQDQSAQKIETESKQDKLAKQRADWEGMTP